MPTLIAQSQMLPEGLKESSQIVIISFHNTGSNNDYLVSFRVC